MKPASLCAILVLFSAAACAQQLQFEVASIKPHDPNEPRTMFRIVPGGSINMVGVTLKMLITQAYDVRDFQVSGGPAWMNTEKYDITAKAADSASEPPPDPRSVTPEQMKTVREQMQLRLQALLADRFQLKLRHETREMQVYALVVAKGGPKMKESEANGGAPRPMMRMSPGGFGGQQVGMAMLAQSLSQRLGRTVIDETGLKGNYDFELNFTPDQATGGFSGPGGGGPGVVAQGGGPPAPPPGANPGLPQPPPIDPNGPTIFTAIQDQLGLKLESKKGPVEILVIDHAEKASEN
jgi:bla regulator protein blaR1